MANPDLFWYLHNVYPMKTNNSREPPFRFKAHDQQNMAGAISVDQFSPVYQIFDFTLGFVYVIATLHYARQWSRP